MHSNSYLLTINGGSSSIKFAVFGAGLSLDRLLEGSILGIGLPEGSFAVSGAGGNKSFSRMVSLPDYSAAVQVLMDWLAERAEGESLTAVGHRVVHGGPEFWLPQRITEELVAALHQISPFAPEHLPGEILLIEAIARRFPSLTQIACFDTAFHHDLPRVARMLPIPRRYEAKGIRRYGFHGLSCAFLMEELAKVAGEEAAQGRVILAHLGNGASVTAVRAGRSMDTSMALTPAAGLTMSRRSGDLDPGLALYLEKSEGMTQAQFHDMVNHESGLLGISETSSDMRTLVSREAGDDRAAEAVALFCYQARKWICAMAGALGGVDTLVFAGGIGEYAPGLRARICVGLEFMGIDIDEAGNAANAGVVSKASSDVTVRVIHTDEESYIAKTVCRVLGSAREGGNSHGSPNR